MKKETINKVTMDPKKDVEIFCSHRYKGYHIRGAIFQLRDCFWDEEVQEDYAYVYYRFAVMALVNAAYQKGVKEIRKEGGRLLWEFYGLTEKEYLDAEKRRYLDFQRSQPKEHRPSGSFAKEMLEDNMRNRSLLIDLEEAGIQESEYLNESIKAKKNAILLNLGFVVNRIEMLSDREKERDYLSRIYTIPAFHCPERNEDPQEDFEDFFERNFEIIYFDYECNYLQKREYHGILSSIGHLSYEWIEKNTVGNRYLRRLNRLNGRIGDRMYPLTNFCWKFFDDLVDDLTIQKQVTRCEFCRDFFVYQRRWPTKKFCTLRFEGKDCRKAYHNRTNYKRNPEERKLKARDYQRKRRAEREEQDRLKEERKKEESRIYQRDYRALLKKHGVKK